MAKVTKVTREDIAQALEIEGDPGKLTLSGGKFTYRKEYYWRPNKTEQESFAPNIATLQAKGFEITDVEYGDHYASFKGGEGVKKNSHYWMKFKATRKPQLSELLDPNKTLAPNAPLVLN